MSGKHWPWFIVAMLVVNFIGVGVLIVMSRSDPSHHVEKDYYKKALDWDATMAQRRRNRELGWKLHARVSQQGSGIMIDTTLTDALGAPLADAKVDIVAFHRARAGERFRGTLANGGNGRYGVAFPSSRLGYWELHYRAKRDGAQFTAKRVVKLATAEGAR